MQHAATALAAAALLAMTNATPTEIRTERVTFTVDGTELVGVLHLPAGTDASRPAPGVVVTGAWTTIKEHMAGRYARELAERGYVALAFDFRTWGESGGTPRSLESPTLKTADIVGAAEFLRSRPEVASVGALGVCASSGYVAHAAASSAAIESVALVAPWLHDAAIVREVYGGDEGVDALLATGRAAQAKYEATGKSTVIPAAGPADSNALMPGAPYYTEPDRGAIEAWENTFDVSSWEGWLTFDAFTAAPDVRQPLLIVHSDAAVIPGGARRFFGMLTGDRRQLWLDDVSQFDFYDQDEPVREASDAVAAHFALSLRGDAKAVAPAGDPETASVINLVSSITTAVDLRRFDLAQDAFADEVRVDYTSLFGGEVQTTSAADLVGGWKALVPGFDVTRHELTNVVAHVEGGRATATADIDARHWLNGNLWRPIGTYRWELAKSGNGWRVTAMTLTVVREIGDRALVATAQERATSRGR
ncbi:MAG: nuclear transport factor 2 family protein [Planctomycetota bacterium]